MSLKYKYEQIPDKQLQELKQWQVFALWSEWLIWCEAQRDRAWTLARRLPVGSVAHSLLFRIGTEFNFLPLYGPDLQWATRYCLAHGWQVPAQDQEAQANA